MKKFTKLFLLALCSWFLFLWFGNAQNLEENDPFTGEYDVSSTENWGFTAWGRREQGLKYRAELYPWVCHCDTLFIVIFRIILSWIWMILWILLIVLTVKAVILPKKFNDIKKDIYLPHIPVLNLYSISKITVWMSRFFCIILLLWFFVYSLYNIHRDRCCPYPSRQDYTWIIVWILTIIILSILISKLNTYSKEHSNKELTNK